MALRSVSLCAGIGGIDLGLERLGAARSVCYVEREAFPASRLVAAMQRGQLAEAPIWSDLRTFDASAWRGSVDLVTGGYPCQPFSHAGQRRGANDPRHLWPEVLRIYRESGARYLFCENVAGHFSLGFADVLADLAALGADVEWGLFRASDVGAPHKRERLFFLADRDRDGRSLGVQLDGEPSGAGEGARGRHAHGCGEDVEYTDGARSSRWSVQRLCFSDKGSAWPPSPTDRRAWQRYIGEGGPQPAVCRGTDGIPYRVDRLRALGNAVVPQVAALAFTNLWTRMHAHHV